MLYFLLIKLVCLDHLFEIVGQNGLKVYIELNCVIFFPLVGLLVLANCFLMKQYLTLIWFQSWNSRKNSLRAVFGRYSCGL